MKTKKSARKKKDAKLLDGIQRACVALGLDPPKKLESGFQLNVQETGTSDGRFGWIAEWSSPVPSKGQTVMMKVT